MAYDYYLMACNYNLMANASKIMAKDWRIILIVITKEVYEAVYLVENI